LRFKDKIVLISGGTRGIGNATALEFANAGAHVAMIFKSNSTSAEEALNKLPGHNHSIFKTDISDPISIEKTVAKIIEKYSRIDILVNNAAYHTKHPIDTTDYITWQKVFKDTIDVNVMGTANLTYCVSQSMIANKLGKIIFVSSRGAFRGEPNMPAYGASKAAINALSQSLAIKLAPYNIHIGTVAPGFVETDLVKDVLEGPQGQLIKSQSPMNRVARPDEVAHAILFFADEKSVWSTGAILDINGASYLRT